METHLYPVWSFRDGTVAVFFSYTAALDFINSELPQRNLYFGTPRERP